MILYADDAVLLCNASTRQELQIALEREFTKISNWYTDNRLTVKVKKIKPHISNSLKKLGHCLSLFNRIFHMLDNRTRIAFYNRLVLPHLDYADTVWGDQPGLKAEMEKLQSFQK